MGAMTSADFRECPISAIDQRLVIIGRSFCQCAARSRGPGGMFKTRQLVPPSSSSLNAEQVQ